MNQLSNAAAKWFEKDRGIDPETPIRYGVYTKAHGGSGEVIVFPFVERGQVVNEKFRARGKRFWQTEGGQQTFWNHDAILDPSLRGEGVNRLVITEGEIDALSAIDCGFPLTVSVPSGAPATATEGQVDPDKDDKFRFVWRCWDALKEVRRIVLAVDNDAPGKVLAGELVRRLGVDRCLFVEYPEGCKDLNEVLIRHGKSEAVRVLNDARPYPVKGLYKLSEYPDLPSIQPYSTGWESLDKHYRPWLGSFVIVTGIPSHGKSTWVSALALNLALIHGWKLCVASFEMTPAPYQRDAFRQSLNGKPMAELSTAELIKADQWIEENVDFIAQNPRDDEEDMDMDFLLDRAATAVVRSGVKVLMIDPWNEVEHRRQHNETETDYISRALRAMRRFARRYDVCVILVAHPTKMGGAGTKIAKPTLYDISGSANWYNKCDAGIVIWREDIGCQQVEISVKKVRFKEAGKPGSVNMIYQEYAGRFVEMGAA